MEEYQQNFARLLADTESLHFAKGLFLKDGRETPYFVSIGKFRTGRLALALGEAYANMLFDPTKSVDNVGCDVLFGPSYKGSAIAQATAMALWGEFGVDIPFEYDRKEAKAHGEASGKEDMFVNGSFYDGARIFLLDDVGTSMATKYEALEKIAKEAKNKGWQLPVVGIGIAVDREQTSAVYNDHIPKNLPDRELAAWKKEHVLSDLKGEDAIEKFTTSTGIPVRSIVGIQAVVNFLYESQHPVKINGTKQPISSNLKHVFDAYQQKYESAR